MEFGDMVWHCIIRYINMGKIKFALDFSLLACLFPELRDKEVPIWVSLSEGRTELYRQIVELELGHSRWLERYDLGIQLSSALQTW